MVIIVAGIIEEKKADVENSHMVDVKVISTISKQKTNARVLVHLDHRSKSVCCHVPKDRVWAHSRVGISMLTAVSVRNSHILVAKET